MLTALQMRERTNQMADNIDDLGPIIAECAIEADKGNYRAFWYARIGKATLKKLREMGYNVTETDNQHDGYTATISW